MPLSIQHTETTHNSNRHYQSSNQKWLGTCCNHPLQHHHCNTNALPLLHWSISLASYNAPAIAWAIHGCTTSNLALAYLLHYLAHQYHALCFNLTSFFTLGYTNHIADCCSCLFHWLEDVFLNYTWLAACDTTTQNCLRGELSTIKTITATGIATGSPSYYNPLAHLVHLLHRAQHWPPTYPTLMTPSPSFMVL